MCPVQAYTLKTFSHFPQALLVYRVFRKEAKRTTKILHGLLHVAAFIIALVGEFLGTAFLPPPLLQDIQSLPQASWPGPTLLLPGIPGSGTGSWPSSGWTKAQKFWLAVCPGFPFLSLFHVQPCPQMAPVSAPGLVAVFDYHKKKGYADLYSLHGWCGITVFILYLVQVSLAPLRAQVHHRGAHSSRVPCPEKKEQVNRVGCCFQSLNWVYTEGCRGQGAPDPLPRPLTVQMLSHMPQVPESTGDELLLEVQGLKAKGFQYWRAGQLPSKCSTLHCGHVRDAGALVASWWVTASSGLSGVLSSFSGSWVSASSCSPELRSLCGAVIGPSTSSSGPPYSSFLWAQPSWA